MNTTPDRNAVIEELKQQIANLEYGRRMRDDHREELQKTIDKLTLNVIDARDAAIEECAQIVWRMQSRPEFGQDEKDKWLKIAENSIRALKEPAPQEAEPTRDFEKWAKDAGYSIVRNSTGKRYEFEETDNLLECWQAAFKAGRAPVAQQAPESVPDVLEALKRLTEFAEAAGFPCDYARAAIAAQENKNG